MLENPKLSFDTGLITRQANMELSEKENPRKIPQKNFHDHYCLVDYLGINDWDFTHCDQSETHKQLKERKTFWQHQLKTFYPLGLNEKLILTYPIYESQTINNEGILAQFYFCQLFNH